LRNTEVDQGNRLDSQNKIVNNYSNLVFDKPQTPSFGDKISLFDKNHWENWKLVWQKEGIDPNLTPYTKIRSKWVHDLGIKNDIINKLEEYSIVYFSDLWRRKEFVAKELEITIDRKIDNFDYIKLKSFCTNKNNADKVRREAINQGNIFTAKGSDKGLISKIYRKLTQIYNSSNHSPIDKWSKDMNRQFLDEEIETIFSHMKSCSKSLLIREMQIKTTLRYHYTPVRLAKMTGKDNDGCWKGCGKTGTLIHYGATVNGFNHSGEHFGTMLKKLSNCALW
uniref:Uncharacterized protein n=1 Tax=Sarcophilus harrisii TaxID=9305 RepID=A0A7N4P2P4_SARHA